MRIATYILIVLLLAALGGGAYFYVYVHRPIADEYTLLKAGQPGLEKVLQKYRDREKQETGWTGPLAGMLQSGLAAEIAAGKAEVVVAGNQVVVNLVEEVLYTPRSVTFARDGQPMLLRLAGLLQAVKDKEMLVGNTTQPAPAQGRGRRRVPAKDARSLASARSHELVKFLTKNGVPDEPLVAAAYGAKMPDRGFKIKGDKTIIIISAPPPAVPLPAAPAAQPQTRTAPVPAAQGAAAPAAQPQQQKPIPIMPAPPRTTP